MSDEKKKDDLKEIELRIISSNPSKSKEGAGYKLRLVQYHKDGKSVSLKIESGPYFPLDKGGTGFSRKGLTRQDVEALLAPDKEQPELRVIQVLLGIMKNPPPIPLSEELDEEVPF